MMSSFSGPQRRGAKTLRKQDKRAAAELRNAKYQARKANIGEIDPVVEAIMLNFEIERYGND